MRVEKEKDYLFKNYLIKEYNSLIEFLDELS